MSTKNPAKSPAKQPLLSSAVDFLADDSLIFTDSESPFSVAVTPGEPRLILVTGDNASGKSLFVRALGQRVRGTKNEKNRPTVITLSIRERIESGIKRALMYGDEHDRSTGGTSIRVVRNAIEHNLDRPGGSLLILDEPEIGLAESYATAYGRYIAQAALDAPTACLGFVVVTHSRALVAGLAEVCAPTFVHTAVRPAADSADGADGAIGVASHPASVAEWLTSPSSHSIDDLLALPDTEFERWRAVNDLIKPARP